MAQQPSHSATPRPVLPRGQRFASRFDILDTSGFGGESTVYKVRDQESGAVLALKVYDDQYSMDPKRRQAFMREVELGGRIQHPNVVKIIAAGESGGHSFLIMEFLSGRTLAETLEISERLSVEEFLPVFCQMASALSCLHQCGVVHRDIKPGNLMFGADGVLKLMDFGIARNSGDSVTVGVARGSMDYAAPEQLLGQEPSTASDLFALGAVSYEVLTGTKPFAGRSYVQRTSQSPEPIGPLVPRLPSDVARAIDQCLDPDYRRRPHSAIELLALPSLTEAASRNGYRNVPAAGVVQPPVAMPARALPAGHSTQPSLTHDGRDQPVSEAAPQKPKPQKDPPPPPPARTLGLLLGDEPRPPIEALSVMASLLSLVRRITEAGDAHDPITPETVRLRSDGEPEISRRPDPGDRDTWVISTPRYSAPELLRGETHLGAKGRRAAVLYSAGLVFYEILLGKKLFNRAFRDVLRKNSELAWMEWQVNQEALAPRLQELLPALSADISTLFERLLDKDPAKRLADYREAETAVHRCIRRSAPTEEIELRPVLSTPASEPAESIESSPTTVTKRGALYLVAIALIAALLLAAAGVAWWFGVLAKA
ncbi:MAG: protein kinase [Bryobacterales bacterium]|nr:protein kinase [Bryobacterales bacterium]